MMNNTVFTSTAKRLKNGNVFYTVYADGVEIGARTTAKRSGFKFAFVCQRNYAYVLQQAKANLAGGQAELAKYEGYLANPEASIAAEKTAFHRDNLSGWLRDGTVVRWIESLKSNIVKHNDYIATLLTQNQNSPEFQTWSVAAFSNTGKDAARVWQYNARLVPLTQPEVA